MSEENTEQPEPAEASENAEQVEENATPTPEQVEVKIDTSEVTDRIAEAVLKILEAKELEKPEEGKGEVSEADEDREKLEQIAERLRCGKALKEQWTVVLPKTTKEIAAHLRDVVFVSPVIKGKQGDTVNCL